jgi:hypothetical protein
MNVNSHPIRSSVEKSSNGLSAVLSATAVDGRGPRRPCTTRFLLIPRLISGYVAMAASASKYARAFGQPPCKYGNACYQQSRSHWEAFDHPATHPRFQGLASMSSPADDGESRKRKEPPASEPDDAAPLAAAPSVEMAASAPVHQLPVPFTAPPSVPPAAAPATAMPSSLERSLRGVPVPAGWGVHGGSLLVWRHMSPVASPKVGAFDFDG